MMYQRCHVCQAWRQRVVSNRSRRGADTGILRRNGAPTSATRSLVSVSGLPDGKRNNGVPPGSKLQFSGLQINSPGQTRPIHHYQIKSSFASSNKHYMSPNRISTQPYPSTILRQHLSTASAHHETSTMNISGGLAKPVSEAQRRSAQLELDRMNRSTSRLLGMKLLPHSAQTINSNVASNNNINEIEATDDAIDATPMSEAIVNEARVAIHYWSRRWYMHFHPGFGRAAKGSALSLEALRNSARNKAGADQNKLDGFPDDSFFSDQHFGMDKGVENGIPENSMKNVSGDHGAHQAERLLDWSISNNLIPHGIFKHSPDWSHDEDSTISPNLTCVNIIETNLLPCAYGGMGGGNREFFPANSSSILLGDDQRQYATLAKHFTINSSYIRAVVDATRVMKKMKQLQSEFPDHISSDSLSVKAELSVWSKRALLLRRDNDVHGGGGIHVSTGGHSNVDMLRSLEIEDASIHGTEPFDEDAYTMQGCLNRMEAILSKAEEQYLEHMFSSDNERMKPDVDWYNHVLGAWARSDVDGAVEKMKEMLHGMEAFDATSVFGDATTTTRDGIRPCWASPDTISYNITLFGLARSHGRGRAKEAEALLRSMKERYRQTENANIRPDDVTYGTVLNALAQAGMAHEAESILDLLEEEYGDFLDKARSKNITGSEKDAVVVPNTTIYNSVLNAWANSFERNASRRAESLLNRMQNLSSTGKNPAAEPDTVSISTVISCHARSKTRDGAERAEELLDMAMELYSKGNAKVKPDSIMYNCVIAGWANCSGNAHGLGGGTDTVLPAERAEALLERMNEMRRDGAMEIRPVVQTYNIVLDCWAKSERKGAAERALNILREMPDSGVTPDECTYNSVLHAMSKEKDPIWVNRAEEIFEQMKKMRDAGKLSISEITYHVMMNVYGKSSNKDGAQKAEELLRGMQEDGASPNSISYNICIDAYARRALHHGSVRKAESFLDELISLSNQGNKECQPTIHTFASVVNALAKSGEYDAVDRAEKIVQKAEELVPTNTVLYNSLIDCIVRTGGKGSAQRAEGVLRKMELVQQSGNSSVKPDSYAYSLVLTCCARSKERGAAERAAEILRNMETLHSSGHTSVVANSRCYSAVITAWARSGSPDAVQQSFALLDRMEQNVRDGNPHGKPNAHCYNACIHAIAKGSHQGKAGQCEDILQRMISARDAGFYESAPSLITYSTIINACAYTSGNDEEKKEAFDLARSCFQTLLESNEIEPCASSFSNFLLVISRHLQHGPVRDQLAEAVFHEGCKRGKIGKQALFYFQKASPLAAGRVLPREEGMYPEEWSCNVKNERKSRA